MKSILIHAAILLSGLALTLNALADTGDQSMGIYAGRYYDTEPASMLTASRGNFMEQYLVAITASKRLWRSQTLPISLEIDGMLGHQQGLASVEEIAVAPVLRWSSFPWKKYLQTDVRFGPLGISYTSEISPLEKNKYGQGSRTLNFLMVEFDFSLPDKKSEEIFIRQHHRCTIYDLLNDYGANGEDFLTLGYRHYF